MDSANTNAESGTNYFSMGYMTFFAVLTPIIASYITTMTNTIVPLFKNTIFFIFRSICDWIKKKYYGEIVLKINIREDNECYDYLDVNIFNDKVMSEYNDKYSWLMDMFSGSIFSNPDQKYSHFRKLYVKNNNKRLNLNIDYSKNKNKLYCTPDKFGMKENIKKFLFGDYIVWITKKEKNKIGCEKKDSNKTQTGDSSNNMTKTIQIKLFKKNRLNMTNSEYSEVAKKFLDEKFNFSNKIKYVYKTEINRHYSNISYKLKYMNDDGILNFTDNSFDYEKKIDEHSNSYNTDIATTSLDCYKKDNLKTTINEGNMNKLKKYWKYDEEKFIVERVYEYEYAKKLIFAITGYYHYTPSIVKMAIVSPNKMNEEDINEVVDDFITKINNGMIIYNQNKVKLKDDISIHKYSEKTWKLKASTMRTLDTVYLKEKTFKDIMHEMHTFIEKKDIYEELQIPYKKGILFYGPPGTGKTSIIKALGYHFQFDIFTLNLNDPSINDDTIDDTLTSIPGSGIRILLLEDIDHAFADKNELAIQSRISNSDIKPVTGKDEKDDENKDKNKENDKKTLQETTKNSEVKYLTFSGLLNGIDGVHSGQSGIIIFMTTNHIDVLGEALIRPGRIDTKYYLGACDRYQVEIMIKGNLKRYISLMKRTKPYFEESEYMPADFDIKLEKFIDAIFDPLNDIDVKPCKLQAHIVKFIDNVDDIFNNIDYLLSY